MLSDVLGKQEERRLTRLDEGDAEGSEGQFPSNANDTRETLPGEGVGVGVAV